MNAIWKFELNIADQQGVPMPEGAEPLHVGVQHGHVYVWALVNPQRRGVIHRFAIRGTGHEFDGDLPQATGDYIGTVQQAGGDLVWHVFDLWEA